MKLEKISISVRRAHECVAERLADDYCRNIMKDTDNTFGTLDGIMSVFALEIADKVRENASRVYAVHNVKFRPELVKGHALWLIKESLRTDAGLREKLTSIRAAQKAEYESEVRAEHATYAPLPVAN